MREAGFYWVRTDNKWIVAEWYEYTNGQRYWLIPGWDRDFEDDYFEEIDGKRLIPEEK